MKNTVAEPGIRPGRKKLFLFFTHGDSREHVLPHTPPSVYSRPFPHKLALPEKAVHISLKEYLGVLGRMLKGETGTVRLEAGTPAGGAAG